METNQRHSQIDINVVMRQREARIRAAFAAQQTNRSQPRRWRWWQWLISRIESAR
jgi:hypothetical protein